MTWRSIAAECSAGRRWRAADARHATAPLRLRRDVVDRLPNAFPRAATSRRAVRATDPRRSDAAAVSGASARQRSRSSDAWQRWPAWADRSACDLACRRSAATRADARCGPRAIMADAMPLGTLEAVDATTSLGRLRRAMPRAGPSTIESTGSRRLPLDARRRGRRVDRRSTATFDVHPRRGPCHRRVDAVLDIATAT